MSLVMKSVEGYCTFQHIQWAFVLRFILICIMMFRRYFGIGYGRLRRDS